VQYARVSGFVVLHFGQYQVILLDGKIWKLVVELIF